MRELLPQYGPVDVAELLAGLTLGERAGGDRPYTLANFVASADGRTTFDGGSTGLGDAGDSELFHALRGCADAVLAGTGTLHAEHYGRLIRKPERAERRAALKLAPQPILSTITRSGSIPLELPLLDDPESRMIIYSGAEIELGDVRAAVEVVRIDREELTVTAALRDLRARHGVRLLLCEGGPTILAEMIGERVLDELFLTVAAKLAGGDGPGIVSGLRLMEPLGLRLRWLLEQDDELFLRYALGNSDALDSAPNA